MSKYINVNPGNYKVAGRERQGEDINQEVHRQALATERANERHRRALAHETAPGWEDPAQPFAEDGASKKPRKPRKARKARKPGPRARVRATTRKRATPVRRAKKGQSRARRRAQ